MIGYGNFKVKTERNIIDFDEESRELSNLNTTARRLKGYHWHAWDLSLLQEAMACTGAVVEYLDIMDNWHQLVIARVPAGD